jgi:hypothetical protein
MDSKNTVQQGLGSKVKSWFKKRKVLWIAMFILRVLKIVFRIYEYLTS